MLSNKIKQKIRKDYNLPIQVFTENEWNYFVSLYSDDFDIPNIIKMVEEAIKVFGNEETFNAYTHKIQDEIIAKLQSTDAYLKFQTDVMPIPPILDVKCNRNIYSPIYCDKRLVSIDIRSANFISMRHYDAELVLNCESFEELVSMFTDIEYLKKSKSIRQVIFGNLNPKRQQKIQENFIKTIVNDFNKEVSDAEFCVVGSDEFYWTNPPLDLTDEQLESNILELIQKIGLDTSIFRVTVLTMSRLWDKPFYVLNDHKTNKKTLKGVPSTHYAQAYKMMHNLPITDNDLIFQYEGQLAKFLTTIEFITKPQIDENNN